MSRRTDRLVAAALIGGAAVVAGFLGLASLYLGIIGQAVADIPRGEALPDYFGRPANPTTAGMQAQNYLIVVADADEGLSAVLVGHLSAGRDRFDLVSLPSNLLVGLPAGGRATLGDLWLRDPLTVLQGVEGLLDVRMDHELVVDVTQLPALAEAVGGVGLTSSPEASPETASDASQPPLPQLQFTTYLTTTDPVQRLDRITTVSTNLLIRLAGGSVLSDPARLERVTEALTHCLTVDGDLTAEAVKATALGLRLGGDAFASTPIPVSGTELKDGFLALSPDPARIAELTAALRADAVAGFMGAYPGAWEQLRQLPNP